MEPKDPPIREFLAAYAHESWAGWMLYLRSKATINDDGSWTIPKEPAARWTRQMNTAYYALPETEQRSDLVEADKIMDIFKDVFEG